MSVRVIAGDCREILPDLNCGEVVITDPVWPNCPKGLLAGWEDPMGLFGEMCERLPASVKRLVIVLRSDSAPRFLSVVPKRFPYFNAHWLPYALPGYLGRKLGGNEIAYAFGEPIPAGTGRHLIPSMAPKAQPSHRPPVGHPCSRALVHMEWLVNWWSEPGETVIDPFAGSGTLGIAADRQQRDAILIEIDPNYAELARRRVSGDCPMFTEVE